MLATIPIAAVALLGTQDVAPGPIVETLQRLESASAQFRTTYSYATLAPLPISDDPQWEEQSILEAHHSEFTYANARWKLELRVHPPGQAELGPLDSEVPPHVVAAWTGNEWIDFIAARREFVIRRKPPNGVEFDILPYFNMTDGPGMIGGWSLGDTFLNSQIVSQTEDGAKTTLRLAPRGSDLFRVSIVLDREPSLRLSEVVYDILVPPGEERAGDVKTRVHYHVAEWREYNGVLLPQLAYRDGYLFRPSPRTSQGSEPIVSRSVFRRHSYEPLSDEEVSKAFMPPDSKHGDVVLDEAARLRYRVGDNQINVDGFVYETVDALPAQARHELHRLISIEQAEQARSAEQVRQDIERHRRILSQEARRDRVRTGLVYGASTFAIVLVLGFVFDRVRRHGRKIRCATDSE